MTRIEGLWWMMRPHFYSYAFAVAAGWFASGMTGVSWRLFSAAAGLALLAGAAQILNDILDARKDTITAPYLPLPRGVLSVQEALIGLVLFLTTALVLLLAAPPTVAAKLVVSGCIAAVVLAMWLYSNSKSGGFLAPAVIAVPYAVPAIIGWAATGLPWRGAVGIVVADLATTMFFANPLSAIRDEAKDAAAGNHTLAIRWNLKLLYLFSCIGLLLSLALTGLLVATSPRNLSAWAYLGILAAVYVFAAVRGARQMREVGKDRRTRSFQLRPIFRANFWRMCLPVFVFSPVTGALLLGGGEVLSYLQSRGYRRRIVDAPIAAQGS